MCREPCAVILEVNMHDEEESSPEDRESRGGGS